MAIEIDLTGYRAVVGGSTQGIGRAIAESLAAAGASCCLLARDEAALKSLCDSLPRVHPKQRHHYLLADFSQPDHLQRASAEALREGPVHILINNTGGPRPGPVSEAQPQDFLNAYQQHLLANHLLVQAFMPGMKEAGYGRIINIVSTSVRIPIPNLGVSNTTRAAVAGWAKTLSNELAAYGITVNNILPGLTETARLGGLIASEAKNKGISEEEMASQMRSSVPAKRFAQATEPAALACFLASPLAGYITGVSIPVDGGRTGSI